MKNYYDILQLNEYANDEEIKARYNALRHDPDKVGDKEQFQLIEQAYQCLIGTKDPSQQLKELLDSMRKIGELGNRYLHYDTPFSYKKKPEASQVTPVFLRSFYAFGEAMKLCQGIVYLFDQRMLIQQSTNIIESFNKTDILPCVNKVLTVLQSVYQFEHHDMKSTVAGALYQDVLTRLNAIYKSVRPELMQDNKRLFKNNPHNPKEDEEQRPSILPDMIFDVSCFIDRIGSCPSVSPIAVTEMEKNQPPNSPSKHNFFYRKNAIQFENEGERSNKKSRNSATSLAPKNG